MGSIDLSLTAVPSKRFVVANAVLAILALPLFFLLGSFYLKRTHELINPSSNLFWLLVAGGSGYAVFLFFLVRRPELLKKMEIFVILPIAVLTLVAEAFLAAAEPLIGRVPDPFLDIHRPNIRAEFHIDPAELPGMESEGVFSTDSQGFRTSRRVDYRVKDERARRIFLVGGSTTEQLYIDDIKTTGALLESMLAGLAAGADTTFEVVNTGKSGLKSIDHYFLLEEILKFQPDVVVVLAGANDMNDFLRTLGENADDARLFASRARNSIHYLVSRSQIIRRIYYLQAIWSGVRRGDVLDLSGKNYEEKRRLRQSLTAVPLPEKLKSPPAYFAENIDAIIGLARENGVQLVLLTQPALYLDELSPELDRLLWMTPGGPLRFSNRDMAFVLERFNDVLRARAGDGVEVVDLARLLPKDARVFYDDFHFNLGGAERVARLIAERLRARP